MELPAPLKVSMRARNSLQRDTLDAHVPGLMDMMSLCSPVTARVARHPMSTNHGEHPRHFPKAGGNMVFG